MELVIVHDRLCINKLSLSVSKTKFLIFRNKNKCIDVGQSKLKINNIDIEQVSDFNFLGITINDTLSWKPHIDKIRKKVTRNIGILNSLKRILPPYILRLLYFSLIQSHFSYGITAWGFDCQRLEKVQKKAIRTITNSKFNAHSDPLFKQTKIMKISDLFQSAVMSFFYKYKKGTLPNYFLLFNLTSNDITHRYPTRIVNDIIIPFTRTTTAEKCIRNLLPKLINVTPESVLSKIDTHSFKGFVSYMKLHFIDKYTTICQIPNCYICSQ